MSLIIKIGLDVEFMATLKGKTIYPVLGDHVQLENFGCDEFGHCVEARPKESDKKLELLTNISNAIARLPIKYRYHPINAVIIPKMDFFTLLKQAGNKPISSCGNIYQKEILEEGKFEKKARNEGCRVAYCGMHVHISTVVQKSVRVFDKDNPKGVEKLIEIPVPVPYVSITRLMDDYIFSALVNDTNFNSGRYRSKGFYDIKANNHFEYRSLGVTAFTPKRVAIIFDMVKYIVEHHDALINHTKSYTDKLEDMRIKLITKTNPEYNKDLKKLWVPWRV